MFVLNKYKTTKEEQANAVYIGHGSPFGNPFITKENYDRIPAIAKFRLYFAKKLIQRDPAVENAFRRLKADSNLLCFCAPKPCHGNVISEFWHEIHDDGYDYERAIKIFEEKHRDEILAATFLNDPVEAATGQPAPETPAEKEQRNSSPLTYNPLEDGVTHINVWSKGRTELGRLCSNFAHTPFIHPDHGHFLSVEGYWYWLSTGKQFQELRSLHGFDAKKAATIIKKRAEEQRAEGDPDAGNWPKYPDFEARIKKAILCKVLQTPRLMELLKESTLPLAHYYVWGDPPNHKVTVPSEYAWTYKYLESIRKFLNGKAYRLVIAGSRTITSYQDVEDAYKSSGMEAIEIVSGTAKGVDTLGEMLANRLQLPIRRFPADWERFGKSGGMIRNIEMADYGDGGLLLWDGVSKGTKHMESELKKRGKPYTLVYKS